MALLTSILFLIAIIGFIVAGYYTTKLAIETKGEKYWYFFAIAAFTMALHQITDLLAELNIITELHDTPVSLILHIIAGLSMAYASYGIVTSMIKIRKKIE